jgi:hypothetical protein
MSNKGDKFFQAFSTVRNEYLAGDFYYTTSEELEEIVQSAQKAFFLTQLPMRLWPWVMH